MTTEERLEQLRRRLASEERVIVAFSGGVDSALLAAVASESLGRNALAVTAVSPSLAPAERTSARAFARAHGIRHLEVCTDEGDRVEYRRNDGDRCYHCKTALFDALEPLRELLDASVAVGTIVDDLGDHRPGLQAAALRGATTPLADAGFTKSDVRRASHLLGLETAEKPAAACLASRVAYGDEVTPAILERVGRAEDALGALGFEDLRVRAHGSGSVARIEVPADALETAIQQREALQAAVLGSGFDFATLDLGGLRSGSMNVLLRPRPNREPQAADARARDLDFAVVDVEREERQGVAETVYAPGKSPTEIGAIVETLLAENVGPVMATRIDADAAAAVAQAIGGGTYHEPGRVLSWRPRSRLPFRVALATAGTTDGPVAAEAAAVAETIGLGVERIDDVGVAGLHRLLTQEARLHHADAVIVVAGMEGALASVIGGLVSIPVIAVPTSTGYGAALEGVTALLAMLSSCAAGITVVNVDNGYGAALAAYRLARSSGRAP